MPDKPWKPSRRERRVFLALLSGASNLSGFPIMKAAQVGSGRVYLTLARLERLGWVRGDFRPGDEPDLPERRYYHLTPDGRQAVMDLLELEVSNG